MSEVNVRDESKYQARIPILSFFSGGGFLDMGFEQAGFNIAWTNEFNPIFADMHEYGTTAWRQALNNQSMPVKISDRRSISNIKSSEILKTAFPQGRPEIFGVIGGPPCPDFSTAGKNNGGRGKNGRFSRVFVNHICKIKPDFFVFENVPGLFKTKPHRRFLKKLENQLEDAGFVLDLTILNALELGIPQDRERLVMLGFKASMASELLGKAIKKQERGWFRWPFDPRFIGAKTRFPWPGIHQRGDKLEKPAGIPGELMVSHIFNGTNPPSRHPNGKEHFVPYSKSFLTALEGDTKRKSFKRLHRYRYSPTACYGHNEVHLHPWENRRLTVREAMRIQGIPDSYALPSHFPLSAKFAMVSNGVPVPMANKIAVSLHNFIFRNPDRGRLLVTSVAPASEFLDDLQQGTGK